LDAEVWGLPLEFARYHQLRVLVDMAPVSLIRFRTAFLERAFNLLYGPLVLLHETAGAIAFGPAWAGRRLDLLDLLQPGETIVDVGAGSGALVREARKRMHTILGVDPSAHMRAAAAADEAPVIAGYSWDLPIAAGAIDVVMSTYPGPWIFDGRTTKEFERVLNTAGRTIVLLGGTIERGPRAGLRRFALSIAYGDDRKRESSQMPFEGRLPEGELVQREDRWGTAYVWIGVLAGGSPGG
jgi:SAM-dependent methyltransferase